MDEAALRRYCSKALLLMRYGILKAAFLQHLGSSTGMLSIFISVFILNRLFK